MATKDSEIKEEKFNTAIEKQDSRVQEVLDDKLKEIIEMPKDDPISR